MPSQPIEPVRLQTRLLYARGIMSNPEEVPRIKKLLERLIAFQKIPIGTIENQMGVSQGYLSRLFSGRTELKYQHIVDILEAIEISLPSFFKLAYEAEGTEEPPIQKLSGLATRNRTPEPAGTLVTLREEDLERVIMQALAKLDLVQARPQKEKPPKAKPPKKKPPSPPRRPRRKT